MLTKNIDNLKIVRRIWMAIFAGSALLLGGCVTAPGSNGVVYNPGTVHLAAKTDELEDYVAMDKEEFRELKDRFDALERLYVDLAKVNQDNKSNLMTLESSITNLRRRTVTEEQLAAVEDVIKTIEGSIKKVEARVFDVEIKTTMASVPAEGSAVPVGARGPSQASVSAMRTDGPQVSGLSSPEGEATVFGVHLGSYRSRDQIPGSWAAFLRIFGAELNDMSARVYVQSQQGIGDFLRLIAGPAASQEDAKKICDAIKLRAREQFCVATPFQGEPLN